MPPALKSQIRKNGFNAVITHLTLWPTVALQQRLYKYRSIRKEPVSKIAKALTYHLLEFAGSCLQAVEHLCWIELELRSALCMRLSALLPFRFLTKVRQRLITDKP